MNQNGESGVTKSTPSASNDGSAATQHDQQQHTNTKNGPIITPRPYKSYLKIMMDESVFETLHSSTQQIISSWVDAQSTINPEERPKLKIKSRSLQSLHMTYFFMGTILEEMHPQEVTLWNSMLKQKLCNQYVGKKYALKFRGFETFPPQRRNLIVASFESSEDLDQLYEELCELAMTPKEDSKDVINTEEAIDSDTDEEKKHPFRVDKQYEFPLLRSAIRKEVKKRRQRQMKHQHSSPWVSHVTLANIVGGKNGGTKLLGEWLSDQQFGVKVDGYTARNAALNSNDLRLLESDIGVQGLKLGGPHP
jgi:2'-5' RNA ligase